MLIALTSPPAPTVPDEGADEGEVIDVAAARRANAAMLASLMGAR